MGKSIGTPEQKKLLVLLRQIRLNAGLRQEDLAHLLGKPQPYVSRYESGERRLDLLELRAVCVALRVKLTDFVSEFEKSMSVRVRKKPTPSNK
jgi:transcriptional regulator with XRE-family HTH domain